MSNYWSQRFTRPLGGDQNAGAGAFKNAPLDLFQHDDWFVYRNDFAGASDYDATNDWTLTQLGGGGSAAATASNTGVLRLDAPAQDQGPIIQFNRATTGILPAAASASAVATEAILAVRFALTDADASDAFVGLAELTATSAVLTTAGALTSDTHAGFHVTNALNGVFKISVAGTDDTAAVTSSSVFTLSDAEWVDVAVRVVGTTKAYFYYRENELIGSGVQVPKRWKYIGGLTAGTAWDARMYPTIATVGDAAGDDLDLDKVVFAVKRDTAIDS